MTTYVTALDTAIRDFVRVLWGKDMDPAVVDAAVVLQRRHSEIMSLYGNSVETYHTTRYTKPNVLAYFEQMFGGDRGEASAEVMAYLIMLAQHETEQRVMQQIVVALSDLIELPVYKGVVTIDDVLPDLRAQVQRLTTQNSANHT